MEGKMVGLTTAWTLLLIVGVTSGAQQAQVVITTLGPIRGLRKTVLGTGVDVYYGIPFAKPPVGDLRFKRPEPAEPWTEVKATVTKPNACFQTIDTAFDRFPGVDMWNPNTPLSEDCLYLNVWVPRGSESPNTTMVWIYGGGFYSGSSALDVYDASKLAVTQNVIVASMNYRVGPQGFLYTGTADAPGNQGLLDQSLALKWIHDNVARFGGRPDSITIFGESAGAISVGLHLLSLVSRDHFTRAIMQSGAPSNMTQLSRPKALQRAQTLSAMLNCPQSPLPEMVQCLRMVSAEKVTSAQWGLMAPGAYMDLPMRTVVDGEFLTDDPWTLLAQGEVKDAELLIGTNRDEGSYFLVYGFPDLFPLNGSGAISDEDFKALVHALNMDEGDGAESLDLAVLYQYVDRLLPVHRPSYWDIADDITGDQRFVCPCVGFAAAVSALKGCREDVYLYSFHHRLSNIAWPEWMGVMHGYEIEAVFGLPLEGQGGQHHGFTLDEEALADRVMGYWTRFAKTGNPNGDDVTVWPKLTSQEAQYLKLTGKGDSVEQGLRHEQCTFRSTILPLLRRGSHGQEGSSLCLTDGQGLTTVPVLRLLVVCSCCVTFLWTLLTR